MIKILKIVFFTILIVSINNCEVDDICTEEVLTPKLIIRFYNNLEPNEVKPVEGLFVWAESKDSLFIDSSLDSIALPLNNFATETKYLLSINSIVDTLYLHYENHEVFVSRSCGYKFNFTLQNETSLSNHWTTGFETIETPQNIVDEQAAHFKIYH